jgi:truncated hemoglobin YjbI
MAVGTVVAVSVVACNRSGTATGGRPSLSRAAATRPAYAGTLYARLGGEKAIRLVVDDFVRRALANPRANLARKGTPDAWEATPANVDPFKRALTAWLVERTGGPKGVAARDGTAARGMEVRAGDLAAAADDLRASLAALNVDRATADELVAVATAGRG